MAKILTPSWVNPSGDRVTPASTFIYEITFYKTSYRKIGNSRQTIIEMLGDKFVASDKEIPSKEEVKYFPNKKKAEYFITKWVRMVCAPPEYIKRLPEYEVKKKVVKSKKVKK